MKRFEEKARFSASGIFIILLILNVFWYGLLIFNRFEFANTEEIQGAKEFGLFCAYFFALLLCIVLSGFELRLIDEHRHRVYNMEAKIDYFLRLATFGLSMLLAAVGVTVKNQIIAMVCELVLLSTYELIFIVLLSKQKEVIIDWTNRFYIRYSKEQKAENAPTNVNDPDKNFAAVKLNILRTIYFVSLIILTFFAVGIFEVHIGVLVSACVLYAIGVVLLSLYKVGKNLLASLSGVGTLVILTASYFVSIYVYNLSFLFLFVNCIVQIPFIKAIFL